MQKRATEVEKERGENGLVMSNQEVLKNMFIPETLEPNSQVITKKHTADKQNAQPDTNTDVGKCMHLFIIVVFVQK